MKEKVGEKSLAKLIAHMKPILNDGDYVFATVSDIDAIPRAMPICEIKEKEGTTVILSKEDAEQLELSFEYVVSWITLNVHSSLEAVGLTAAFSATLAKHHISCNVVAGYYHDHIFVDKKDKDKAFNVLKTMSEKE